MCKYLQPKNSFALIGIFILAISCNSSHKQNNYFRNKFFTSVIFKKIEHDFGIIKMNSQASIEFKFKNTGNKQLVITNITTGCDCAEPIWQKKPVKPGKSGIITINYDTSHPGIFMKTISVYANIENNPVQLKINGIIEP